MCCFSQPIDHVSDTKIFSRLSGQETQFVVYEMAYQSKAPNAIILPLPVSSGAGETQMRFISLEDQTDFFDRLAKGFPYRPGFSTGIGCSAEMPPADHAFLAVHQVGNFVASFVPTIADFQNLDPQFVIPKATWDQLPQYSDYGFAVFQLENLAGKPHPMAFEFPTRWTTKTFFPTVHIHDGQVHQTETFDHQLYLQHAGLDSVVGEYANRGIRDPATGFVRSNRPVGELVESSSLQGIVQPDLLVHRTELTGRLPNEDQVFPITGDPLVPSWNSKKFTRYLPWLIPAAGIGWFLKRRQKIRRASMT